MSRFPRLRKGLVLVQITALVICTLPYSGVFASPVETEPTTAPTQSASSGDIPDTDTAPEEEEHELTEEEKQSVQALQQQRTELQAQAKELQEARQTYADTLDGLLKQKEAIESEIALKQREIDINEKLIAGINEQIHLTDEQLIEQEQHILVLRQQILSRFTALQSKMRALSKGGRLTTTQMLLSSETYKDFLINKRMANRLAEIDQQTLNGLEEELAQIESQRDLLKLQQQQFEEQKQSYQASEQALETTKNELLALLTEAQGIETQLNSYMAYYQQQYMVLYQQQTAIQMQINDITKEIDPGNMLAAAIMNWPAPGCSVITSSYKARWGRWHYGVDIASWGDSTGKPIVAAADGVVIYAGGEPDTGYGYYIMVDHGYDIEGKRIVTLYGHCSELFVQVGDAVFGGQTTIAAVGNTGNSTGPHLHFEVRVDGSAVDPVGSGYLITDGITIAG